MLATYAERKDGMATLIDGDRTALPLLGFVLGIGISVAAWSLVGSLVWLTLG